MAQFYVVNESTEDTLASADDLPTAVRLAREQARQAQAGDLVAVLQDNGAAVWQFIRLPNGTVAEQAIAHRGNPAPGEVA